MEWVTVEFLVICKYCGEPDLAWQKSKADRWYLCQGRFNPDSREYEANRRAFHRCPERSESQTRHEGPAMPEDVREWAVKIITAGYRHLSLKAHPDQGGNTRDMQQLNQAVKVLRSAFK